MKKHVTYECEICHRTSRDEASVEACEKRGKPDVLPVYTIIADHSKSEIRRDRGSITFAVVKVHDEGHGYDYSGWACRDNGAGDSLGDELCGPLNPYGIPDPNDPTFKRMVAYLKKNKHPIHVFLRGEALPLDTFLSRIKRNAVLKKMGVEA